MNIVKSLWKITSQVVGVMLVLLPSVHAESINDWSKRALKLQAYIDNGASFSETMWVGTHNSYNSYRWHSSYQWDPNQLLTIEQQLNAGAREIVFDIVPVSFVGGTSLLLCHKVCEIDNNKKFRDGLRVIRDWLSENPYEVVLLKIEIEGFLGKAGDQIESVVGDLVYKPGNDGVCRGINPQTLTKDEIIAKGKNMVILTTPVHGCDDVGRFNNWVFTGFDFNNGGHSDKFEKVVTVEDCNEETLRFRRNRMFRAHDGSTWFIAGSSLEDGIVYTKNNIDGFMQCGMNVIELFNFNAPASVLQTFDITSDNLRSRHLVWSWAQNKPSQNGATTDCAQSKENGRFEDAQCNLVRAFACFDGQTDWQITSESGVWKNGQSKCQNEFGDDYFFAVPVNAMQNESLKAAKQADNVDIVWVNYHDQVIEGVWQSNTLVDLQWVETPKLGSGGSHSSDDWSELERDLYLDEPRKIRAISVFSGFPLRVDAVRVEFSQGGISTWHGPLPARPAFERMSLDSDEFITQYEICIADDAIRYLEFTTNKGNSLVSGVLQVGKCTVVQEDGKHLAGLHSKWSVVTLKALGGYFREDY